MRTGLLLICIILTMTACFHKKKELPERKPVDFQMITNAKRTIAVTAPSLGWRKTEKSPYDLALVRDGTTIQIGILTTKKERTPDQLFEKAIAKLRIAIKTETTFTSWSKRPDTVWRQGEGIVRVSSKEKFEVPRMIQAYSFNEQKIAFVLIAVGLAEEMMLLTDEIESIVQSVHATPKGKSRNSDDHGSKRHSGPPPVDK